MPENNKNEDDGWDNELAGDWGSDDDVFSFDNVERLPDTQQEDLPLAAPKDTETLSSNNFDEFEIQDMDNLKPESTEVNNSDHTSEQISVDENDHSHEAEYDIIHGDFMEGVKGKYDFKLGDYSSGVLTLGGKRWLIGMHWDTYGEKLPKKEIINNGLSLGNEEDPKPTVALQVVEENLVRVGYGYHIDNLKLSGLRSLAASIAKGIPLPILGMYRISEEYWWFIAIGADNAIMPGSDRIGTYEQAYQWMQDHAGASHEDEKLGSLANLEEIIEAHAQPTPALMKLNPSHTLLYLTILAFLLVLAGGYELYQHHERAMERLAHQRALLAQQAAKLSRLKNLNFTGTSPLLKMPLPNAVLAACEASTANTPMMNMGWIVGQINCEPGSVSIVWNRLDGATLAARPDGVIQGDGNSIIQNFATHVPVSGPDNSVDIQDAVAAFRATMQAIDVQSSIVIQVPPPTEINERAIIMGAVIPLPSPPPNAEVNFIWPFNPSGFDWDKLPGFRILQEKYIKGEDGGLSWQIKGVIYGTPLKPVIVNPMKQFNTYFTNAMQNK